ncbi:MAG: stage V sporulation protein AD [Clostridiaceae bacterium]|jgi:stage V sporulation protein AD|nr:stage V sporulation protein AD [Clostridiaceae bacterium]HOA55916.1 stage V sporulation protein AD [Clostridiales bacterium]HPZ05867.1 stage V sporulation protein AD [Clostridiales bacterium]HQD30450.1 stage V sporulation protein AD [Clostridiales bacterium]
MLEKKAGKQTSQLQKFPSIIATASIVGPKEGKGPLADYFDQAVDDEFWGEKSWEKAESKFMREVLAKVVSKASMAMDALDFVIAGDLLNQCIAANFGIRESNIPFYGIYGACSTIGEAMQLGAALIEGGFAFNVACLTSSHFCSAEKQFRFPLELGSQRPPTAQWTVTGSGGIILSAEGDGPYITRFTTGKIVDMGIKDQNNMGAAMAPAAADTIYAHFEDTGLSPDYYDMIVTGDLGKVGKRITEDLLSSNGIRISKLLNDCGLMIFDSKQDVHAGGSGCGCAATVFAGFLYDRLKKGKLNRILFVPTGALLSPTSVQQGETIPCIAHAVAIENTKGVNQ